MFFLYDVDKEIDIQFCLNTFEYVISFFSMPMNIVSLLKLFFALPSRSIQIVYILYGRETHNENGSNY